MGKLIRNLQVIEFLLEKELNDKEYILDWIFDDDRGELTILFLKDGYFGHIEEITELTKHIKQIERNLDLKFLIRKEDKKGFSRYSKWELEEPLFAEFKSDYIRFEVEKKNEEYNYVLVNMYIKDELFKYSFKIDDKFNEVDMIKRVLNILHYKIGRLLTKEEETILTNKLTKELLEDTYKEED